MRRGEVQAAIAATCRAVEAAILAAPDSAIGLAEARAIIATMAYGKAPKYARDAVSDHAVRFSLTNFKVTP